MNKFELVCFDVDGTLVDGISWHLLTEGLGCSRQEDIDIFNRACRGEVSFIKAEKLIRKMYQESGNANKSFIKKIFDGIKIRREARNLISCLRKKGYKVYLISGAIDIYIEIIAKKLKVDGYLANSSLVFDNKGKLQKINYRHNQEEIKVKQLRKLVKKLGISMNQVAFVGDNDNDIEVFKETKHGIAVFSSSEELKKVAWKKIDSLEQIKDIL